MNLYNDYFPFYHRYKDTEIRFDLESDVYAKTFFKDKECETKRIKDIEYPLSNRNLDEL